jgi:hypothetical protein
LIFLGDFEMERNLKKTNEGKKEKRNCGKDLSELHCSKEFEVRVASLMTLAI